MSWKIYGTREDAFGSPVYQICDERDQPGNAYILADVRGADQKYPGLREFGDRNAKLIAAAPDLLKACERALAEADEGLTIGCIEDLKAAVARARKGDPC